MAWVLIIWFLPGGPTTAEFSSKEACMLAGEEVIRSNLYHPKYKDTRPINANFVCVKK